TVCYDPLSPTGVVRVMAGFRYLDLDERLTMDSVSVFNRDLTAFPAFAPLAGNTLQVSDAFATHNHFYGGQRGIAGTWWPLERLSVEGGAKLGIGTTAEDLEIAGGQLRTLPNGTRIASPAGLLALASNSGSFHSNRFALVPELNIKFSAPLA